MLWQSSAIELVKTLVLPHRNWLRAQRDIATLLTIAMPGEVICLVGPSRVGKSKLLKSIETSIGTHAPAGKSHLRPFVSVVCENNGPGGTFLTKQFALASLASIGHPMLQPSTKGILEDLEVVRKLDRSPEGAMKTGLRIMLKHFQTSFLAIDEAAHVEYVAGGAKRAESVLNSWKAFAATSEHVLIVAGAYSLLPLMRLSPHMVGRKFDSHFPRYHTSKEDLMAWEWILDRYSGHLRFVGSGSLRDWNQPLYEGSIGCVGRLNAWLRNALRRSMMRSADHLEWADFESTRIPKDDWVSMYREIEDGEKALDEGEMTKPRASRRGIAEDVASGRRRPKKKPRRYPVGTRTDLDV